MDFPPFAFDNADFEAELLHNSIIFHTEDIDFQIEDNSKLYKTLTSWLIGTAEREGEQVGELNYIFCSDDYLHKLNVEYLDHDTLTDIITFPTFEEENAPISGDMYISIERVRDNANDLNIPFDEELRRVLVHGLLHLCGYLDETDEDELLMRQKEDEALVYFDKKL